MTANGKSSQPAKPRKKPGPRNTGPSAEQRKVMLEAAERGATNKDVAQMNGIAESTLYRWIASEDFGDFGVAYARAKAKGRFRLIEIIADHAEKDWRAAAWLLERMDPTHWGRSELDGDSAGQKIQAFLNRKRDGEETLN